jgi:ferredoxin--NADP+ reductase
MMGPDGSLELRQSDETETLDTTLVLRAVGYRARPAEGLPFDVAAGLIPNEAGRVLDPSSRKPLAGLFCAGWIKRGATGVIGSNRICSAESVAALIEDYLAGRLREPIATAERFHALVKARQPDFIDNQAWQRIEHAERVRGTDAKRPRIKFVGLEEMLAASRGAGLR